MSKALAIGEIVIILKEIWDSTSDFFMDSVPDNFYKIMNELTFLTPKFLGISSDGSITDKTYSIAEAIINLSNIAIWGILLFFGFKSIFSYFISKKVEIPWKFFIRMIIFGVLANAAFFICYTGIYVSDNCTEYIRQYTGEDNSSFLFLEDYVEPPMDEVEEENIIYTTDVLLSLFLYFSTFFTAICLGARYILIKVLILTSPIFFILGGFSGSEKIFFKWCKSFFGLVFLQIFLSVVLIIINLLEVNDGVYFNLLACAMLLIFCKNILKFISLKY